ncbi:SocA family protein [Candidatus Parcubacteria bacterium]|nr:SocA family protein [Candidatus Parcubacteria bacterium]
MSIENTKNNQLIAYIVKNHPKVSVTGIMKLCYLIDLFSIKKGGSKISDFNYVRYYYGPYDKSIRDGLDLLVQEKIVIPTSEFTPSGADYVVYSFNEDNDTGIDFNLIEENQETIDVLLENLKGYGAKTLTEVAYKTKPMLKLGATLGGDENIGVELDLNAR